MPAWPSHKGPGYRPSDLSRTETSADFVIASKLAIRNAVAQPLAPPKETINPNGELENDEKTLGQRAPQTQNALRKTQRAMQVKRLPTILMVVAATAKTKCRDALRTVGQDHLVKMRHGRKLEMTEMRTHVVPHQT